MGDESITHKGIPTRLKYAKVPKNNTADTSNKKVLLTLLIIINYYFVFLIFNF